MRRRTGFTIVELLVAMALIVFIMAILSEAFAAGFKAFRDLKALGDMNERLRSANTTLRRYLEADHFEGRKRLSDPNFWTGGPPREGFFRIEQDDGSTVSEGVSSTLVSSFRSAGHRLHFTAKLRGNDRGDFFPASFQGATNSAQLTNLLGQVDGYRDVPGTYHAQWLEVMVFLRPSEIAVSESGVTPGQLYSLHLRARALIPEDRGGATAPVDVPVDPADRAALADFSLANVGGGFFANTPADVTIPARRSPANRTLGEDDLNRRGADVLLTDVLSMNVRVFIDGVNDFMDLRDLNTLYPQLGAPNPVVFDTFTQNSQTSLGLPDYGNPASPDHWVNQIPRYQHSSPGSPPIRIKAIQLQLRIWDQKTEQTRQTTLIVDL